MFPGSEGVREVSGAQQEAGEQRRWSRRGRQGAAGEGAECVYVYIDCGHLWVNLLSQLEVDTLIRLLILLTLQYTRSTIYWIQERVIENNLLNKKKQSDFDLIKLLLSFCNTDA